MSVGTRVPYVKQLYAILAAELTDDVPTAARRTAAYLAQFCDLDAPSGAIKVEVYGDVDMVTRVARNDDPRASAEFMPAVRSFLERGGVPFFRLKGVTVGPVLPPGQPGDGPAPAFTLNLADRARSPAGLHSAHDTAFQIAPHKNVLLWRRTFSRVNVLVFNTANPPTVFTPALLENETYLEARNMAVVTGDDPLLFAATIARAFDFARLEGGAPGVVLFDKSMPSPDNAYTLTKYAQAVARFIDWEPTKAETMLPTTEKRKIARSAAAMKGRQMEGDVPFLGRAKVNLVQFPTRRGDYLGFAFPESVAAGVLASIMKPVGAPSTSACAGCGAADAPWVRPAGGAGGLPGAAVCGAACALAVGGKVGNLTKGEVAEIMAEQKRRAREARDDITPVGWGQERPAHKSRDDPTPGAPGEGGPVNGDTPARKAAREAERKAKRERALRNLDELDEQEKKERKKRREGAAELKAALRKRRERQEEEEGKKGRST